MDSVVYRPYGSVSRETLAILEIVLCEGGGEIFQLITDECMAKICH